MSTDEKRHTRGLGRVYARGPIWWIQFNHHGKTFRKSSESTNHADAVRLLNHERAQAAGGKAVGSSVDRTTIGELAKMLIDNRLANGCKVAMRHDGTPISPMRRVLEFFGEKERARDITADRVVAFVVHRQQQGAAAATINRSLANLKRAFNLGIKVGKVATRPEIDLLDENNAREGFLTHAEFIRLRDALPVDLRDPVEFLYRSGWRVGEMRSLQWRDVDVDGGVIRLRSENSKNKKGRVLPLSRELRDIIERAEKRRTPEQVRVFRRDDGGAIGLFRKAWMSACEQAGLGGKVKRPGRTSKWVGRIVHDLRRTAVRNMIRAGISMNAAMQLSGHKTADIFRRYDIVDERDLSDAMQKLSAHLDAQPTTSTSNVVPLRKSA